ncbi:hypothetical protein HDU87_008713 [Geranomyces variabilis]|uniref:Uncharacterized protein n=1 Tax=Geranomyces variabilis TaxID=109894 RepID=A0AAD5TI31_9FUNG|nr:hypothetical protein HDU87_008713 [Geranomyces variabilis]
MQVFQATETHDGITLHFQLTRMEDSLFAWVGTPSSTTGPSLDPTSASPSSSAPTGRLLGLSVAMPTKYDRAAVSTILLPASSADDPNEKLARRLATKHGIQVFVALDLAGAGEGELVLRLAERRLAAFVKEMLVPKSEAGAAGAGLEAATNGVERMAIDAGR